MGKCQAGVVRTLERKIRGIPFVSHVESVYEML
jgi:hypothetical protein